MKFTDKLPTNGERILAWAVGQDLPHTVTWYEKDIMGRFPQDGLGYIITSAGASVYNISNTYDIWEKLPTRKEMS